MPFTASHPAAVLPFLRSGPVPAALVIGSMVPDLPYYTRLPLPVELTHSWPGVVGVDLLMGAACFVVWVVLLAPAAIAVAGERVRRRLPRDAPAGPEAYRSPRAAALVVAGLVIGAATHVVWDAFTHLGRWGPEHVAWLREDHGGLAGYRYAQYGSGLVGAVIIVAVLARWWRRASPPPWEPNSGPVSGSVSGGTGEPASAAAGGTGWGAPGHPGGRVASPGLAATVWVLLGLALVLGGLAGAWLGLSTPPSGARHAAFLAATTGGACAGVVAVGFSGWWRLR